MKKKSTNKQIAKKRNKKPRRLIFKLCLLVLLVLMAQIIYLNLLPVPFLILVSIILLDVLLIGYVMLFKSKFLGNLILVMLLCLTSMGNVYLYKTSSLFDSITSSDDSMAVFNVMALKDNKKKVKTVGILTVGNLELQGEALDQLSDSYKTKDYDSLKACGQALYDGKVDSILVGDSSVSLLTQDFPEFENETRVVEQYKVKTKVEDLSKNVNITREPFTLLISGRDAEQPGASSSRSDVNILMTINPSTHQILMLSIPRDFYVAQPCQGNQEDKLTHTGMFGVNATVETVENMLDLPINYYVQVNFESLVNVVDALGGITVNVPKAFTTNDDLHLKKGDNELNGAETLDFARERYAFVDGDRERGRNQMRVLEAIIDKAMSPSIIRHYADLMDSLSDSFKTNMSQREITSFIRSQLLRMKNWDMKQIQVNGSGSTLLSPALGMEAYVMVPNEDTVENAAILVQKVLDGELVTDQDVEGQLELCQQTF